MLRIINPRLLVLAIPLLLFALSACSPESPQNESMPTPPEWSYDATIYEVNVRQFSEEGNFANVEEALPRLKELGIDILWLMPIHPIGEVERKGPLGSYYSVKDYYGVNPAFGTKEDFRSLVEATHEHDMKLILDWVANHTAWDNELTETNPEFYETNEEGNFIPPRGTDWSDVIQLDYSNPEVHDYMADALRYWVEEFNIDGYRADVASYVPTEFWNRARAELDAIKPVFMLAEAYEPELHPAFDMSYHWDFHHLMNRIAQGEGELSEIDEQIAATKQAFGEEAFMMNFITNHDENSWAGTTFERLGDGKEAFAVLMSTVEGMPLIYNGQETGLDKMLEFFEKDPIDWDYDSKYVDFYTRLMHLKRDHPALQNGSRGGALQRISTSQDDAIYAFSRSADEQEVVVVLNLSDEPQQEVILQHDAGDAVFQSLFENHDHAAEMALPQTMSLDAWEYHVFYR